MRTLGNVCGAAAVTPPPKEVWENEPGVLEEDSVCMVTALPPHTVMLLSTWTMACRLHLFHWIGHPAAQTQSTGALVGVLVGVRTAGTLREGAAVTVGAAPRVLSAEIIV